MKVGRIVNTALMLLLLRCLHASPGMTASPIRIVDSDHDKIVLELNSPQPRIESVSLNGESYSRISIEGAESTAGDGTPELPQFSGMVAIPMNASYKISYEKSLPRAIPNVKPYPVLDGSKPHTLSEVYSGSAKYPSEQVTNADDAWLRDFRVLPLQACPFSWDPVQNSLIHYDNIRITIDLSYPEADGGPLPYSTYSYAFQKIYEAQILNFADYRELISGPQSARLLIIHGTYTDPTFISKLNEFVTWKRQKGFEVSVAGTAVTGSSSSAIKSYIQSQYDEPATRPDFIILLGDVSGSFAVPTFYVPYPDYLGEGDYPYTYLSGGDMLGDAFIGRISAENVSQLITLYNKIYVYEKNVNINPPLSSWMNRMMIIGDPTYSGRSCIYVSQFIHDIAEYANPEYEFIENYINGFVSTINSGLNQGVGFFTYRGYYGVSGWSPSASIFNSFKLPHAVILTCETGSFAAGTSLSEEFTRMGTGTLPAGAATCVGMSTGATHTAFNNALSAGIMSGIFSHGLRTMGEATLNGKLYLHTIYGATQLEMARTMAHWCNLIGDPTLETWVGIARQLNVTAPASIPSGTAILEISVRDSLQAPVEDVCITAYSSSLDAVVAKAFTGPDGIAALVLPQNLSTGLLITASIHDFKPVQQTVIIDATGSLTYASHQVIDDGSSGSSGNADGFANATETIALVVELRNTTSTGLSGLNALLSTDNPGVQISQASSSYPDLASGSMSPGNQPFIINLDPAIPPVENIRLVLSATDAGSAEYQSIFYLNAYNACLSVSSHSVIDGANGILDPGEACGLNLVLHNDATYPALDLYGEMHSLNSLLVVSDSISYFGNVQPGSQTASVDGFQIRARSGLVPGMQMPMRLRLYNTAGFEQICLFNIAVGSVGQNTPLGPDEYGYLIYDDTDTAYQDCPVYEWVEIVPSLGGMGSIIPNLSDSGQGNTEGDSILANILKVLDLPFSFRFYGIEYDQITVCVNGFIAFGTTLDGDFRNARLPGGQGPCPMIAPFWDDLYLPPGSGIYQYYDEADHRFIIQYHNLRNGYDNSSVETFQLIFYDPVFHHSGLGDGMIKIQYKIFNNVDVGNTGDHPWQGNYCTVGIKDHSNTRGLEYTFNNTYPPAAAPLMNERALLITTVPFLHQESLLVAEELIIIDTSQDAILEPGETAELGIWLKNLGQDIATNVSVSLSSQSQYATFSADYSSYPDIQGSESAINRIPFIVYVSDSCPNGTLLNILCEVNISGASWSYPLSLSVQTPVVNYYGYYINDAEGNGNGILEPGENAVLVLNFKNNSPLPARNLSGSIATTYEHITLLDDTQLLNSIPPWDIAQAVYRFNLSSTASLGTYLVLNLSYLCDQNPVQNLQITVRIGSNGLCDDFENSNGNYLASPNSDAWQWGSSQPAGSHSGTKVWGTLLNQQYPNSVIWTLTSPSFYLSSNCFLEFWHYLDTQSGHDGGNLKITTNNSTYILLTPEDGYPQSSVSALGDPGFSGSSGWSRVRFDLAAYASHNVRFRWTFASDSSIQGQGWFIDDVITIGYLNYAGALTGEISFEGTQPDYPDVWVTNQAGITANPDASGIYRLYLPVGSHSLHASAPGFKTDTAGDLVINPDLATLIQNFQLIEFKPVNNFDHDHSDDSIQLSWAPPAEPYYPVTGYKVMRRMNAGAYLAAAVTGDTFFSELLTEPGTYQYYVQAIYDEGESLPSATWSVEFPFSGDPETPPNPGVTKLMANFPNPFNPHTIIAFDLATPGKAQLKIFNLRGQLVKTLCDKEMSSGSHRFVWDGRDKSNLRVASGVYFYRLIAPKYVETRKMLLMK